MNYSAHNIMVVLTILNSSAVLQFHNLIRRIKWRLGNIVSVLSSNVSDNDNEFTFQFKYIYVQLLLI